MPMSCEKNSLYYASAVGDAEKLGTKECALVGTGDSVSASRFVNAGKRQRILALHPDEIHLFNIFFTPDIRQCQIAKPA